VNYRLILKDDINEVVPKGYMLFYNNGSDNLEIISPEDWKKDSRHCYKVNYGVHDYLPYSSYIPDYLDYSNYDPKFYLNRKSNNEILCKTFCRDHCSPSGVRVDEDVNYFIKNTKGFELVSMSCSNNYVKRKVGEFSRDQHFFNVVILYKINE